jgi:hypothetical protein
MSKEYGSDAEYRERAARQMRTMLLVATVIILLACITFGAVSVFRDPCTGSFDRSPTAVVESYLNAIARGNGQGVVRCWDYFAYNDLQAGCSEICLSHILGTRYRVIDLKLGEPYEEEGRARVVATVSVLCPDCDDYHRGEIVLDGITSSVPWRQWRIVRSTFGGTAAKGWCK